MRETDNEDPFERDRPQMERSLYLRDKGPPPRILESKERFSVARFIKARPALTEVRQDGLERFLGRTSVLPDGRLLLVFLGQPDRKSGNQLGFLVWSSTLGACLRLILRMRPHPKQAVLIPSDAEFAALKRAQVVISFWRFAKLDMAYELDYRRPDHAEALAWFCDFAVETHRTCLDAPEVFWDRERILAYSVSETFQEWFTRRDWLQLGWIKESRVRIPGLLEIAADLPDLAKDAVEWGLLKEYPVLRRALDVAAQPGSARDRLTALLDLFNDIRIAEQWFFELIEVRDRQLSDEVPQSVTNTNGALIRFWNARGWNPNASDWGRRQHYIDGPRRTIGFYTIDVDGFHLTKEEEAQTYWQWLQPWVLVDAPAYLDSSDMPVDPKLYFDGWRKEAPDINPEAAAETVKNLLDEATALRQWTIPPRAEVILAVGPFVSVELTEVGDEVYFVWRPAKGKYWLTNVSVRTQNFTNPFCPQPGDLMVEAAMRLFMAALIRDFWIVEERHSIFDIQVERVPLTPGDTKCGRRVVYLPRIRYVSSGLHLRRLSEGLEHGIRARHYVRSFFRRVQASPLQQEIARRRGIGLPPGHTYVRGHYRGGDERQTVYRSRSALSLLYEISTPPTLSGSHPMAEDWFAFERAIATLLEHHLGFTIVDRGVCGRGDQGIDILATKVVGGRSELWVVQCKHYSDNPVGPRIIRELLGSMTTVRHDEDQTVRAMLVTTGRITGDALKLAATQGVQTYDGTQPGLKWSSRVMLDPVDLRFLRQQVFKMPTPPRRVLALAIAA